MSATGMQGGHHCETPEYVDIGEQRRLRLHLLGEPPIGLALRAGHRCALGGETRRHVSQCLLVERGRRNEVINETIDEIGRVAPTWLSPSTRQCCRRDW